MDKRNYVLEKSFDFALKIIEFVEILESKRKFAIANQLIRSGTSIGANINEAQSAESRADFVHKLKIADKEAVETKYWLELCKHSKTYPDPKELLDDLVEIKKLLNKIISSSKKKVMR